MNTKIIECIKNYKFLNIKIINDKENKRINETVKQIYVINLFEHIRKRNYIYVLFKKYKINYNIIIVDRIDKKTYDELNTKMTIAEVGCCLSHLWCLYNIVNNNYENAIIFEDDVILSKTFIESFLYIYKNNPKLDFLLLGAHDYNFSKKHFKNVKNGIYKPEKNCQNLYGAHANFYSSFGAKKMLFMRLKNLSFFDDGYNILFETIPNSYICYPNLAITNMSESSIDHQKIFFSDFEVGYYNLCFNNIKFNDYNIIYPNLLDLSLLKNDDTVETFTYRCVRKYFSNHNSILDKNINDNNKVSFMMKRITINFFTIKDLKDILSNKSIIQLEDFISS